MPAISDATIERLLDEIDRQAQCTLVEDWACGADDWAYVRVTPDGEVEFGRAASPEYPESERLGCVPHPITVWTRSGVRSAATPADGIFEWTTDEDGPYITSDYGGQYHLAETHTPEEIEDMVGRGWWRFVLDDQHVLCDIEPYAAGERAAIEQRLREWIGAGNLTAGD